MLSSRFAGDCPSGEETTKSFGILPGSCIDCKANANSYSMQLVTISAKTNDGKECTAFMGILADETEGTFIWF